MSVLMTDELRGNMNNGNLCELRKKIIEKRFSGLNSMQFKAVTAVKGPLLILAGAGSGKTTVIVNRIAYLIEYGNAYNSTKINTGFEENPEALLSSYLAGDSSVYERIKPMLSAEAPKPWQILAITFTNKAANELKERLVKMLGDDGNEIWASTFHSACVRILRRYGDRLGYSSHFTIYDTDDSKRVLKDCEKRLGIDEKFLPVKSVLNEISKAKDKLTDPDAFLAEADNRFDARRNEIARVYRQYQQQLKEADAMDFDDIIVNTVRLLKSDREVLEYYQNRFRYIMVDEYQDTNHAQYVLVSMLAGAHHNLCVVGDDDQSIYSFRGANIENILNFEEQNENALVIRLEENYRSTQTILDAANAVIANNSERKGKNLWTSNGRGDKIELHTSPTDTEEGVFVADTVTDLSQQGYSFSDCAVLYRMNAQSNNIERALVRAGVPYRVIGGHRFYERKEIKDALAYLSVVSNPNDGVRLRRIINEPKRKIGETTVNNVFEISSRTGEPVFDIMRSSDEYAALSRSASKLKLFTDMIDSFRRAADKMGIAELFRYIMNESGYIKSLDEEDREKRTERIENLDELYSTLAKYESENGEAATLEGFLEEVALLSDIDNYNSDADTVTLMTLHAAKGLEFPVVFLVGMEDGVFPSQQSVYEPSLLEEERRLAYVGITRAKKKLYILNANSRMQFGKTTMNPPSMFIGEIPAELIDNTTPAGRGGFGSYGYGGSSSAYGGYGSFGGSKQSRGRYFTDTARSYAGETARGGYSGDFGATYSDVYGARDKHAAEKTYGSKRSSFTIPEPSAGEKTKKTPAADIKTGDTVLHKKFGKGLVVFSQPLGNDVLLEVAFDSCGTKKLMAGAARLEKCDE